MIMGSTTGIICARYVRVMSVGVKEGKYGYNLPYTPSRDSLSGATLAPARDLLGESCR